MRKNNNFVSIMIISMLVNLVGPVLPVAAAPAPVPAPAALNAANEVAVQRFLKGGIGFLRIFDIVKDVLARAPLLSADNLDNVLFVDRWAREEAASL